jgi:hypothetical protein
MKQYVIDQLRESDYDQIRGFLEEHAEKAVFDDIYWVEIPEHLYSRMQKEHTQCQPYCFAVHLTQKQVGFEWLIRSRHTLRCNCIAYASPEQRNHIIDFADGLLERFNIRL